MGKIFDTLLGKSSIPAVEGNYMELNLEDYEGKEDATALLVKIAMISDIKDSPKIKNEIYSGNIVIVDISRLKMDKIMYERVLRDLKEVAKDVNGDIIGLGDQRYVVVTPQGVRISRDKIGGAV
ncbi:MAG: cell division protein SepF [Methanomicrobiales archaeon]|nr:cell division protein SepF [Methanomicrobiales archaeon]